MFCYQDSIAVGVYLARTIATNADPEGLEHELQAHSRAWIGTDGKLVRSAAGKNRLCVLFSHHTVDTMDNPIVSDDDPRQRVLGDAVLALLLRYPNVVLWVNGHTHVNSGVSHVTSYTRPACGLSTRSRR